MPGAIQRLEFASAGTRAVVGGKVPPGTASALARRGVDSTGHAGEDITIEVVQAADIVLTMSRRERATVLRLDPGALARTFTLREFARLISASPVSAESVDGLIQVANRLRSTLRGEDDIADPMGSSAVAHERAVHSIEMALAVVVPRLSAVSGIATDE